MSSEVALRVQELSKAYRLYRRPQDRLKHSLWRGRRSYHREVWALRDVSFEVRRGETLGIVGRNGCGKSTLLQIIAGTLAPTSGEVATRGRVAALLELGAGFNPEFTGRENAYLNAAVLGLSRTAIDERFDAIAAFADIGRFMEQPVKTYSSGMYMRVAFATAIHVDAELLVIDEALAVGDAAFQRKCFSRLAQLQSQGTTILFVSHAASNIIELCDRALLLDGGERLLCGSPKLVVTRYHKLLYSSEDSAPKIRDELRALDQGGAGVTTAVAGAPAGTAAEAQPDRPVAQFDPELRPESTVSYEQRGARIENVRILAEDGAPANVLPRGESFCIRYEAVFEEDAFHVRFGATIYTLTGVEICGLQSHPEGDAIELVAAGETLTLTFRFTNRLLPGTYFVRAGFMGLRDGELLYLHRILDACMLRVPPEEALPLIGSVDLSEAPLCEIQVSHQAERAAS